MGDGLLMLFWKNHGSTFSHLISSLREKEHYADVTLACDGKFYPAHKIVLSACSQYFEEMLQNTPCKHPVIVLKDITETQLEALLSYMYVGKVSVSQNHLTALIKAAESLRIRGLAIPDELPASDEKETRNNEERVSPSAKRLRPDRSSSPPPRETQTPLSRSSAASPQLDNDRRCSSYEAEQRNRRLSSHEIDDNSHMESASCLNLKTELASVPPSPLLSGNTSEELSNSQINMQDSQISPRVKSHSSANYQDEGSFHPLLEVKEEYVEPESERSLSDSIGYPPATIAATSSSPTPSAPRVSVKSPTSMTRDLRPNIDGSNFGDHLRSLLYAEAGFHGPGPSGLLSNMGLNMREGYRTGADAYSTKSAEGYAAPVPAVGAAHSPGSSRTLSVNTCEACRAKKVHLCSSCYYSTPWHSVFVRHIRKHTGEKPFICPFCPFRSGWKSHLASHIKKNHALQ